MEEEWRDIDGYSSYQVSSKGRVRSNRSGSWKLLRLNKATNYLSVGLYRNKEHRTFYVHKLVAWTFIGPPREMQVICHNDGNRYNNSVENLRYDFPSENVKDDVANGVRAKERNGRSVLCIRCSVAIKHLLSVGVSGSELARAFGVTPRAISNIKLGKQWK